MARTSCVGIVGILLLTSTARSEVVIRTPYGVVIAGRPTASVGTEIRVQVAPWLDLQVRPRTRTLAAPEVVPPPARDRAATPETSIFPSTPTQDRPATLREFSQTFVPAKGFYEVLFIHPDTGKPVFAHFTLPDGEPRKFRVSRRQIQFDYGDSVVAIVFDARGGVQVEYR